MGKSNQNINSCAFYPCHFKGQDCTFCYCPFYPCYNTKLGKMAKPEGKFIYKSKSKLKKIVWDCSDCTLFHDKKIIKLIKNHIKKKEENNND